MTQIVINNQNILCFKRTKVETFILNMSDNMAVILVEHAADK